MIAADRQLVGMALSQHAGEAARVIAGFSASEVAAFVADWPPEAVVPVAEALPAPTLAAVLSALEATHARALIAMLEVDTIASALRPLDEPLRERLLAMLDDRPQAVVRARLAQSARTAGAVADPHVVALPLEATVADALVAIRDARSAPPEIFVVEPPATLRGQIKLPLLIASAPETPLRALLSDSVESISMRAPVRTMVNHRGWRSNHLLAVVDDNGRLLGSVSAAQLAQVDPGNRDGSQPAAVVSLAELGWLGLTGVLDGLARVATPAPAPATPTSAPAPQTEREGR